MLKRVIENILKKYLKKNIYIITKLFLFSLLYLLKLTFEKLCATYQFIMLRTKFNHPLGLVKKKHYSDPFFLKIKT